MKILIGVAIFIFCLLFMVVSICIFKDSVKRDMFIAELLRKQGETNNADESCR